MMLTDELLPAEDVKALTGKRDLDEQARELGAMGIPCKVREVGRRKWLIVSRHHVREWLAGRSVALSRRPTLENVT